MTSVPVAKVAAAALRHISKAEACFPKSYHDSEKAVRASVHLEAAADLLALIAEPGPMVNVRDDGAINPAPFVPPSPAPLVRGLDD
jgi:hypothetical protein